MLTSSFTSHFTTKSLTLILATHCTRFLPNHPASWAQFPKACKHKNVLSAENCLAETGYQPKFNKVDVIAAGALINFA